MIAYYNEIEPYAAEWLRNLIKEGLIPDGEVDTRSIVDVQPADLAGFAQCHFFAGVGGWAHALRLAGWSDDRPIWTGSCPCQPFSVAGKGLGTDDPRHLWPHFFRLIRAARPPVVMGEQVAGAAGYGWFDGVAADLESENYASRAVDIPACAVDAPHIRSRLYWCARNVEHAEGDRGDGTLRRHQREAVREAVRAGADRDMADARRERDERERGSRKAYGATNAIEGEAQQREWGRVASWHGREDQWRGGDMADASRITKREQDDDQRAVTREDAWASSGGRSRGHASSIDMADADSPAQQRGRRELPAAEGKEARRVNIGPRGAGSFWSQAIWLTGADGKARRAEPSIPLLAHGVPARVGRLRAYGNAIVPQVAAEVIAAFMEADECQPQY